MYVPVHASGMPARTNGYHGRRRSAPRPVASSSRNSSPKRSLAAAARSQRRMRSASVKFTKSRRSGMRPSGNVATNSSDGAMSSARSKFRPRPHTCPLRAAIGAAPQHRKILAVSAHIERTIVRLGEHCLARHQVDVVGRRQRHDGTKRVPCADDGVPLGRRGARSNSEEQGSDKRHHGLPCAAMRLMRFLHLSRSKSEGQGSLHAARRVRKRAPDSSLDHRSPMA